MVVFPAASNPSITTCQDNSNQFSALENWSHDCSDVTAEECREVEIKIQAYIEFVFTTTVTVSVPTLGPS
jgi:hypothetical protein